MYKVWKTVSYVTVTATATATATILALIITAILAITLYLELGGINFIILGILLFFLFHAS